MLDWDDVRAVATRQIGPEPQDLPTLLQTYQQAGATHISIPEITLNRLLNKGRLSVVQGPDTQRTYLQAKQGTLANLIITELQARLPHLAAQTWAENESLISFTGDWPTVAEVGLGFQPALPKMAQEAGLLPIARPVSYGWIQPHMIDRTFDQAAALGCQTIAIQGALIPGHEFNIQHTVTAMQRNHLTYAYFRESRHQKGDWFLAKQLAAAGQVLLAHEFTLTELLDEDWHTAAYRWGNLAVEAGIRLCSVRFFRILHAADPMESVAYIEALAQALHQAGISTYPPAPLNLTAAQPTPNTLSLAGVGLSTAGAAGLAADSLPVSDALKLVGIAAKVAVLAGLPFAGQWLARNQPAPHSDHYDYHHADDHHHDSHHHHHDHHHSHDDHHHHGPAPSPTAYAQKGLALAATVTYPLAATALHHADPLTTLAHTAAVTAAGATAIAATTTDPNYLLGIEEYRGYNLDWLLPLSFVATLPVLKKYITPNPQPPIIPNPPSPWLPIASITLAALVNLTGKLSPDLPARFDREHRHAHTHHLSQFQQQLGDAKLALSAKPLRKWSLLAPLGIVCAAIFKQKQQPELVTAALMTAVAGQVASQTGFRQGQRAITKTTEGRLKGWAVGVGLAGIVWLVMSILKPKR